MNWHEIDRFLMGEAWAGSLVRQHVTELCDVIGPRWGGSPEDLQTAEYIRGQMEASGLDRAEIEQFTIDTWDHGAVSITLPDNGRDIAALLSQRSGSLRAAIEAADSSRAEWDISPLVTRLKKALTKANDRYRKRRALVILTAAGYAVIILIYLAYRI